MSYYTNAAKGDDRDAAGWNACQSVGCYIIQRGLTNDAERESSEVSRVERFEVVCLLAEVVLDAIIYDRGDRQTEGRAQLSRGQSIVCCR